MTTRIVKCLDDLTKENIMYYFEKNYSKKDLAEIYKVSTRTIGRVLEEMQNKKEEKVIDSEFKIGELVRVSGEGGCYSRYEIMATKMGLDNFIFAENLDYEVGDTFEVVAVEKHFKNEAVLYGLEHIITGNQYIMDNSCGELSLYEETIEKPVEEEFPEEVLGGSRHTAQMQSYFTLVPDSVVVICFEGDTVTADVTHPRFASIVEACVDNELELAYEMANIRKSIQKFTQGDVTIEGDTLKYRGEEVHSGLAEAILRLMQEGDEGFKKLVAFMNKVGHNPSYKSRMELFGFVKHNDIEILENGNMLCWKRIRDDWKDCHTGKIDNSVGATVTMERSEVNDDSSQTCSAGLHVCAKSYLGHFGGARVVRCEVDPKDVVSIPTDYNDSKMRCCKYIVRYEVQNVEEY